MRRCLRLAVRQAGSGSDALALPDLIRAQNAWLPAPVNLNIENVRSICPYYEYTVLTPFKLGDPGIYYK